MKKCPLCHSINTDFYKTINRYNLFRCKKCDLLFTDPKSKSHVLEVNERIYSDSYLNNYQNRGEYLSERFRKRIKEIEGFKKGGNILDYGCSNGLFLQSLDKFSSFKWKYYGIDINEKSILRAKKLFNKPKYKSGELNSKSYPKELFDVITCFDVLEHDPNILNTLKIFGDILKPSGVIVIQSPNYKSLMANICGNNWDWWSVPDHVFHFTKSYFLKLLSNNKMKVISIITWDPVKEFCINIVGTIRGNKPSIRTKIIAKMMIPLLYLLWIVSFPFKLWGDMGGLTLIYAKKQS